MGDTSCAPLQHLPQAERGWRTSDPVPHGPHGRSSQQLGEMQKGAGSGLCAVRLVWLLWEENVEGTCIY